MSHTPRPEDGNPQQGGPSRRSLLRTAAALAGAAGVAGAGLPGAAAAASTASGTTGAAATGDRLVMLGVDGGPKINPGRAKPAVALVVEGQTYLVDAGNNTADQLAASGLGFASLRHVFITHHHLDHTSGLMGLAMHGWTGTPSRPALDLWGPPHMQRVALGLRMGYGLEIENFESGGGFGTFPAVRAHDVRVHRGGRRAPVTRVMEDDLVVVDATRVFHGEELEDAYAYRFTVKSTGKQVVFSGDTAAPDANLVALSQDVDVIVHEAQDNDNVEKVVAQMPAQQGAELRTHLLATHSDVRDLPKVGRLSGAGRIVMSHYTPFPQPGSVYLAKAEAAAGELGYAGTLIAPEQLDVIVL
ncbi:MBL fold metallo-hydrolase [Nocardioides insulae]|uniref:MBL fold metallo-hydrolase n=1 Tax=Nocardioides insulae TaxID=394734 RepID=UPI0003F4E4B7|nr:MBL fold metallo-hydrolase [Nocardioides insulae]